MNVKWYSTYCTHCINNVYDRAGKLRFRYPEYRRALDLVYTHAQGDIDPRIIELFRNCVGITQKQVGAIEIDDTTELALLLALINVQVGYIAASHQLLEIFDTTPLE